MCAAVYAAALACSSPSPNLPPVVATGTPGAGCEVGSSCRDGTYCIAAGQTCKDLECVGGYWQCLPDGGLHLEAGVGVTDAAAEAAKGDASGD